MPDNKRINNKKNYENIKFNDIDLILKIIIKVYL